MYYPDLSPYSYSNTTFIQNLKRRCGNEAQILNVGWLDNAFPYEKGPVDNTFLQKLFARMRDRNNTQTCRGFHNCSFCVDDAFVDPDYFMTFTVIDGVKRHLGYTELSLSDNRNIVYIAPDLIYHYITVHGYRPPEAFYQAILALP